MCNKFGIPLNNIFINYANEFFPEKTQRKYAESFISLGLGIKLLTFLPIVSGNKYQWNLNSFEYKTLNEIIARRNKIAHGKDFFQGLKTSLTENNGFSISLKDLKNEDYLIITKKDCDRYLKAFENFFNKIYLLIEQDRLDSSDLIISITKRTEKSKKITLNKLDPKISQTSNR